MPSSRFLEGETNGASGEPTIPIAEPSITRSRDLRPGSCVFGVESTTYRTRAVSDGHGGRRASSRGRRNDIHASIRYRGDCHSHGSHNDADSGRSCIHRPVRMAEPRPPAVHNGAVPPRPARGNQISPVEVAATECQCECRFLPGKPQPFREEPPRALLVFSYAKLDGNGSRLFDEFTAFSHFLVE